MLLLITALSLLLLVAETSAQENFFQAVYDAEISSSCTPTSVSDDLKPVLQSLTECLPAQSFSSCQDIFLKCGRVSSGNYQVLTANGSTVTVYCNMEGDTCGGTGGWMRIAYLDMTNPSHQCPSGLNEITTSDTGKRICVYANVVDGCDPVNYTADFNFTQVCGRVQGYSYGGPNAFGPYRTTPGGASVDDHYVDGMSITLGTSSPRTHLWSYAVGVYETGDDRFNCPCNMDNRAYVPVYVGEDYYCESGQLAAPNIYKIYSDDPLWDGKDCGGLEYPCCTNPNMPWFLKTLPMSTTQDIQVRFCMNGQGSEAITVDLLELYVR